MFKTMSVALLASASCLGAGLRQASAIEATPLSEPTVIYADQSGQRADEQERAIHAGDCK